MSLWIVCLIFIAAGVAIAIGKIASGKKRRKRLVEIGRTATWEAVKGQSQSPAKIVQVNFGYGREVWVLPETSVKMDRTLKAFQTGVLVLPRPKTVDLRQFCESRQIALDLMMVKF